MSLHLAAEGRGGWESVVSEPASFFGSDATKRVPLLAQNWLGVERAETKLKGTLSLGGLSHLQMEKCHIGSSEPGQVQWSRVDLCGVKRVFRVQEHLSWCRGR